MPHVYRKSHNIEEQHISKKMIQKIFSIFFKFVSDKTVILSELSFWKIYKLLDLRCWYNKSSLIIMNYIRV